MKKIVILAMVLLIVPFAHAAIKAVDSGGNEINSFNVSSDVYVEGSCSDATNLTVDVYVVQDKSSWPGGESLTDVSGGATSIAVNDTGVIPRTLIWSTSLNPGEYDIVVDIDNNSTHEANETCIDAVSSIGFTVEEPTPVGSGHLSIGPDDPGNQQWIFGPGDPNIVMLQFKIEVSQTEEIKLKSFKLAGWGSGDESKSIRSVKLVEDSNKDGNYSSSDVEWDSKTYDSDNEKLTFTITKGINAGDSKLMLLVYEMGTNVKDGNTFNVIIDDIGAEGTSSGENIEFSELPLSSGVLTVSIPETNFPEVREENVTETVEAPVEENITEETNTTVETEVAEPEEVVEEPKVLPKKEKVVVTKKSNTGTIVLIAVIIVILLVIIGIWWVKKHHREEPF